MKINIIERLKYKNEGKKLNTLNKNIKLMTLDEISKELLYLAEKNKNSEFVDERFKTLLKEIYSYIDTIQKKEAFLIDMISRFKSDKVKEQICDLYFEENILTKDLERKLPNLYNIKYSQKNKAKLEKVSNEIKNKINRVTENVTKPFRKNKDIKESQWGLQKYKPNPLALKLSHKEEEISRQETHKLITKIKALNLKHNYEEIDLDYLFEENKYNNEFIKEIYINLPEDKKENFANAYINSQRNINSHIEEGILKVLKKSLSHEALLNIVIENRDDNNEFMKDVKITGKDLFNYLKKNNGIIHFSFEKQLDEEIKNIPFEEIEEYLENLKESDNYYIFMLLSNLDKEKIQKLLDNEKLSKKIKDKLLINILKELPNDERIEKFKNYTHEEQSNHLNMIRYFSTDEDEISKYIKDEKIKKAFRVSYGFEKCSSSDFIEVADIINEYNIYYDRYILLNFSDEELKMIYENITNEKMKNEILQLNRKKSTFVWEKDSISDEEKEQIEKYNETVPDSILISEETIEHYLKNANSLDCYFTLIYRKEIESVEFSKLLELYKIFTNKQDLSSKQDFRSFVNRESINEQFIRILIKKSNLKEKINLFNEGIITKKQFLDTIRYMYENLNKDNISEELLTIENIEDIEIKQELLFALNNKFVNNEEIMMNYYSVDMKKIEEDKKNNIEKINQSYYEKILNKTTTVENKYLYLGQLLLNYNFIKINYYEEKSVENLMGEIQNLFKKINYESNKTKYNEIFHFKPKFEINEFLQRNITINNYYSIAKCLPYLNSEKVYELLKKLYDNNNDICETINSKLLDEKIINSVEYEVIEYLSRFGEQLSTDNKESSDKKMELFIKAYARLKNIKTYPEEDTKILSSTINSLNEQDIEEIDFEDKNNIDTLLFVSLNDDGRSEFLNIKKQNKKNIIETYQEEIKEKARKDIHSNGTNKRKALNAIGKRFFNYSYTDMKKLKSRFGADFKILYERYLEKINNGVLSEEEKNEFKALTIFRNINELMEITDVDALVKVFDEFDEMEEYKNCDFSSMIMLEENMKKIYSKDLQNNTYMLDEKDKKTSIDGIDIYSPTEFKIFVHVIAAFGQYSLFDENNPQASTKDKWNSKQNKQNHILCTSYIGNDNMCYARYEDSNKEENVIFGFSSIDNTEIVMASKTDIGSYTQSMSSNKSYVEYQYRLASEIIRKCRHGHNEIDLERRLKDNRDNNIEPEYIVCFNEINEASKKVAKDFNIPIVLINKKEIAKKQCEKLNNTIEDFYKTKNPVLLEEIVNLYQCSKTSFLIGEEDKKLSEEFFKPEKMQETLNSILNSIEKDKKIGNTENADACYLSLYEALEEELNICKEETVDPEQLSDYRINLREIKYKIEEMIKKYQIKKVSNSTYSKVNDSREEYMYQKILNEKSSGENAR